MGLDFRDNRARARISETLDSGPGSTGAGNRRAAEKFLKYWDAINYRFIYFWLGKTCLTRLLQSAIALHIFLIATHF